MQKLIIAYKIYFLDVLFLCPTSLFFTVNKKYWFKEKGAVFVLEPNTKESLQQKQCTVVICEIEIISCVGLCLVKKKKSSSLFLRPQIDASILWVSFSWSQSLNTVQNVSAASVPHLHLSSFNECFGHECWMTWWVATCTELCPKQEAHD